MFFLSYSTVDELSLNAMLKNDLKEYWKHQVYELILL